MRPSCTAARVLVTLQAVSGQGQQLLDHGFLADPSDVAAVATNGISHSAEPTYAATDLLQIPLHQRSTMRYVTAQGFEFLAPATAANGLGVRLVASTAAFVSNVSAFWFE